MLLCVSGLIFVLLLLNDISLYEFYYLFLHFSVDGHLSYFKVLPIRNTSVIKILG